LFGPSAQVENMLDCGLFERIGYSALKFVGGAHLQLGPALKPIVLGDPAAPVVRPKASSVAANFGAMPICRT
ncbi:MAG TPA: hypothetical protein PKK51_13085, partial [Rhodocyclaceae bacterium]|nr:hypothetical protein [Rhodocyclaceae bacterium]